VRALSGENTLQEPDVDAARATSEEQRVSLGHVLMVGKALSSCKPMSSRKRIQGDDEPGEDAPGSGGDHLHRLVLVGRRSVAELSVAVEPPTPERPVALQPARVVLAPAHVDPGAGSVDLLRGQLHGRRTVTELAVEVVAPTPEASGASGCAGMRR